MPWPRPSPPWRSALSIDYWTYHTKGWFGDLLTDTHTAPAASWDRDLPPRIGFYDAQSINKREQKTRGIDLGLRQRIAMAGGAWDNGNDAGIFAIDLSRAPGHAGADTGGRCAFVL